jgi:hypothetical protein
MFGDFSRDSFDPSKHYTRVLMQQGRPLTDADWNEQVTSLVDQIRTLASNLLGWHGTADRGFAMAGTKLQPGHYFVDGVMAVNTCATDLTQQIAKLVDNDLVYIDIWEDSVNCIADSNVLEPALLGIDTSARAAIRWALRTVKIAEGLPPDNNWKKSEFLQRITKQEAAPQLLVTTSSNSIIKKNDACDTGRPHSSTIHNRLYRVEIHRSGINASAASKPDDLKAKKPEEPSIATFKWSRMNGASITDVSEINGAILKVRKMHLNMPEKGSFIELIDFEGRSVNKQKQLLKLSDAQPSLIRVESNIEVDRNEPAIHASFPLDQSSGYFVRHWDHRALPLTAATIADHKPYGKNDYRVLADDNALVVVAEVEIELEDGIRVTFPKDQRYLSGDYWLIRTTSQGTVSILPKNSNNSGPARNDHHYAPLFLKQGATLNEVYRCEFPAAANTWPPKNRVEDASFGECPPAAAVVAVPARAASLSAPPSAMAVPVTCFVPTLKQDLSPASLLSSEGAKALKGYFASPQDLTRRVFARHLNQKNELQSERYKKYRSALLLSEILETSFERYFAKVDRCLALDYAERPLVEADARADYELAIEFERTLMADDRSKSQIA